jgi:type II secretory pathway pseudopilin PulG
MKLSKTTWIVLAIGIFLVLYAALGSAYLQQGQEQNQLDQELSQLQLSLKGFSSAQLSSQHEELENRLTQAESQLRTAKTNLRRSIESIGVTDTLFNVAKTCDVEITEISASAPTEKELEGIICSVLSLEATAEGDVPDLINFVIEVSRQFPSGVAESVQIDVPEVTEEEEVEEEVEEEKPSAKITLSIYTYTGD